MDNRLDGLTSWSNFLYSWNIDEVPCSHAGNLVNFLYSWNIDEVPCMGTQMPCLGGCVKTLGSLADSALGTRRRPIRIKSLRCLTPPNSWMKWMQVKRLSPRPKRVATATRSRAQNRPESGTAGQTEPDQTAGLATGSPQAAHDSSRQAGADPGQSPGTGRTNRGRRRRQRRWNGTRWEAVV